MNPDIPDIADLKEMVNNPQEVSWPRIGVAILIAVVWAALMLIDAFSTSFTAPAAANGALAVVAYLFGKETIKASSNGNGKDKK